MSIDTYSPQTGQNAVEQMGLISGEVQQIKHELDDSCQKSETGPGDMFAG